MVNIDEKELIKLITENAITKETQLLCTMNSLMSIDLSRIIQVIRKGKNCIYRIGECNNEIPCTECLSNYYKNLAEMIVNKDEENKNV